MEKISAIPPITALQLKCVGFFLSFRGHVRDLTVTVKAFWPSPIVSCLDARVRKVERIWFPEYSEFGQRYVRSPGSEPAV